MIRGRRPVIAGLWLCLAVVACARPGADRTPDPADDRTEPVEDAGTETGASPAGDRSTQPGPTRSVESPGPPGDEGSPAPSSEPVASPVDPGAGAGTAVLAGQFSAFVGGIGDGLSCPDDEDPDPYVGRSATSGDEVAVGGTALLCLGGFHPALPIELGLSTGGIERGVTVQAAPRDDAGAAQIGIDLWTTDDPVPSASYGTAAWRNVQWWLAAGTPVGEWSLTATQGSTTTSSTMDVQVGSAPRFVGAQSDGSTVRFHASGFPPGQTPVGLYRPVTPRSELEPLDEVTVTLVEELGMVQADETGAGMVDVDRAALEPGEWCVSTAATPSVCRWLTIE